MTADGPQNENSHDDPCRDEVVESHRTGRGVRVELAERGNPETDALHVYKVYEHRTERFIPLEGGDPVERKRPVKVAEFSTKAGDAVLRGMAEATGHEVIPK